MPMALRDPFDHTHRPISYVVLDCRSERSFHFARLPTAIHIGCDVGYDPELMLSMLERFEGARGSHICVFGTGRGVAEEANLLKIIALRFTQGGFPFVSIAEEGFKGLIPLIKAGQIEVVKSQASPAAQQQQQQRQQQQQPQSQQQSSKPAVAELVTQAGATATEAAAKWGKSLFAKLSSWSLTAPTTGAGAAKASDGVAAPAAGASPSASGGAGGGAASGAGASGGSGGDQKSHQHPQSQQHSAPAFHAGGHAGEDDDDDDELLSELVTTVAAASSPPPHAPAPAAAAPEAAAESPPAARAGSDAAAASTVAAPAAVAAVATSASLSPASNSKPPEHSPHPFDDLFD